MIVEYIQRRIHKKNKNFMAIFCGDTGSGKSISAMSLAKKIDPDFTVDQVVFKPKDFMDLINSDKLKKGSVVVFDEAGVGIPAREWFNISNKMLNYVLQTFRHKNFIVFFTTPDLSFIDSASRKLFHCYFETVSIDYKNKLCKIKPLFIQNNPKLGKIYFKYKYFVNPDKNKRGRITRVSIGLPSKQLLKDYDLRKLEFTSWLNRGAQLGVKYAQLVPEKQLTPKQKEYLEYRKEGLTNKATAEKMRIAPSTAWEIGKDIKKKGYIVA